MFSESSPNHPAPRKADSATSVEKKISFLLEMPFQIKKVSISETGFAVTDPPLP